MTRASLAGSFGAITAASSFVLAERNGVGDVIGARALWDGPSVFARRLGLLEIVRELEFGLRQDDVLEVASHFFRMLLLAHAIAARAIGEPREHERERAENRRAQLCARARTTRPTKSS